ncbi:MAG: chromosome partitioning protein ParA [Pseudomonas sp.]|uniref:chromosome partitioning protein ParA n=1 Tax=Pseudomonas sp. TaxID=306 RepID=UPI003BB7AFDC
MSLQKKPQMVEAVMFFSERGGICKEMLFAEFEALLDGVVNMPEYADQQMRMAYLLINPRLLVRSAVFFYLDFDEKGAADSGWNIPLRHLAENAGRGPDLGAGPIRLACRSQCPVSWHQMHLWDPSLSPGHNDLALLRDAVKRNHMGLLVEDDAPQLVAAERLQMAVEDHWYPADPQQLQAEQQAQVQAEKVDQEQRLKAAQLIKQQRLRINSLAQQHEQELGKFRMASDEQNQALQTQLQSLQQALRQQEGLNSSLKEQLSAQADEFQSGRELMTAQLRALEQHAQTEAEISRRQFEAELQAKVAVAVVEYKEQLALRDGQDAGKSRLASDEQNLSLQTQLQAMQQAVRQQEELNLSLKAQLSSQAEGFQSSREQMTGQLRALEQHAQTEADILRRQFESELHAKVAAAVVEYKEQIAIRDVELAYRNELDTQLEQEVVRLKRERDEFAGQGSEQVLERLSKLGVVFVVYHPGAGHLTIPLADIARYQDNPMAYVAAKCFVSEAQYREWHAHYQSPTCAGLLPSGERCGMPLDRVDAPSRFVLGQSNCCARHKSKSPLRTAG